MPCPPPMHREARPSLPPRRRSSESSFTVMIAPVAPRGLAAALAAGAVLAVNLAGLRLSTVWLIVLGGLCGLAVGRGR